MKKLLLKLSLILSVILFVNSQVFAQNKNEQQKPTVKKAVWFRVSPPLTEMIKKSQHQKKEGYREIENELERDVIDTKLNVPDALVVRQKEFSNNVKGETLNKITDFDGVNNIDGVAPPDTHGDVSPDYYMQCVNNHTEIWDKNGNVVQSAFPTSDFWQGSGYDNRNDGDAVILWDEDAQRWVVTQFYLPSSGSQYLLIAISQTSDPTGSYYQYAFAYTYMPDYPKWAVWPDGYYMGANAFDQNNSYSYEGTYVTAFERDKMLVGDAGAQSVTFGPNSSLWSIFPADADVFPANGTPCPFISDQYQYTSGNNQVYVYDFHVDWANTGNSTFSSNTTFTVTDYSVFGSETNVPQPGTSQELDLLESRIMYRPYFRHFSDHDAIVMTRTVKDGSVSAIRWYEFRNSGSGWSVYQQGTYNPGDGLWRWMPSIAMNANGDIALGYSVSDGSSKYPSIRCVARYANDPLNVMTTNESEFFTGSDSQSTNRWGDYSMMSIDPSDNTSFWYTTEYSNGGWNWRTRIIHFELPVQCTGPSTQATNFSSSNIGDNQMDVNWTRGNGDRVIVLAHEGAPVDADPSNGTSYTANSTFGNGFEIGSGNFVVYDGTGGSVTVTGLTAGTTYYYAVYEYFTADDCYATPALTGNATTTGTAPCSPCYSWGNTDYATSTTRVIFNTIDNASAKPTDGNGNAYSDYTNISTDVTIGSSYDLTVNVNTDGNYTVATYAWVDWNQDCDFDDAGEEYDLGTANNVADGATSNSPLSITVPTGATLGQTTMRVSTKYNAAATSCETDFDGEVEDYTINVVSSSAPTISVSETTLDFGNVGIGYSSTRTYDVSGVNLTNDITVTGTTDFQVSTDGTNFNTSVTVPQSGGNANATITVKFEPSAAQSYSGTITNVSSGATQKDVACTGKGVQWFYPPTNLNGSFAAGTNNVNLTWDAPNTSASAANWYFYAEWADITTIFGTGYPIQVSYFDDDVLGYTYPVKISQLRAGFYDNGDWTDQTYKFIIYASDLTTVLYESPELEATSGQDNVYTLAEPLILTDDFFMGIETIASDGTPYLAAKDEGTNDNYSYLNDGTSWYYLSTSTNNYDWSLGIYVDGVKGGQLITSNNFSSEPAVLDKPINGATSLNLPKSMLTGYRVYKDGTQLGSDLPVSTTSYTDNGVCGTANYAVTAIYQGYDGESDPVQTSITYNSPAITTQPSSQTICEGDNVTFTVSATGNDLTYQWQKDGSDISGATSASYSITGVSSGDAGNYTCDISNVCGSVSSDAAALSVNSAPVAPTSVNAALTNQCSGAANQLTYTGGSGDVFRWYTGSCGGTEIGTGNNLSIAPTITTTYYGRWEKTCGVSSCESVTVTVEEATAINTQPQSQTVCEGDNVTFTVVATGSNLTYQWYKDAVSVSGATSASYTITGVASADAASYTCEVSGNCGTVTSDAAVLSISVTTSITTQPESVNANAGDNVTFSVIAEGSNLSYQWQFNNSDITGETSDTYTINNVQVSNAGDYTVNVSGDCGTVTSDVAVLTVASSVEELNNLGINIYPNPSTGKFYIEFNSDINTVPVTVTDLAGKVLINKVFNSSEKNMIDLASYSKGLYFIKLTVKNKTVVSKLILK